MPVFDVVIGRPLPVTVPVHIVTKGRNPEWIGDVMICGETDYRAEDPDSSIYGESYPTAAAAAAALAAAHAEGVPGRDSSYFTFRTPIVQEGL